MERSASLRSRLDLVAFLMCFLVAAGALLFASAVVLSYIGRDGDPDPVTFDAERWHELPPSKEKHAMGLWLAEGSTLLGMREEEVLELLGRPTEAYAATDTVVYQLRHWLGGDWRLTIRLTGGVVVSSEVRKYTF